jgi:hypothetical protein
VNAVVGWFIVIGAYGTLMALVVGAVVLLAHLVNSPKGPVVDREAQEASWRIHQVAANAFQEMLTAAREEAAKRGGAR